MPPAYYPPAAFPKSQRTIYERSSPVTRCSRIAPHRSRATAPAFATHLLIGGYDIRTFQELLGHKSIKDDMIYTHVRTSCEALRLAGCLSGWPHDRRERPYPRRPDA